MRYTVLDISKRSIRGSGKIHFPVKDKFKSNRYPQSVSTVEGNVEIKLTLQASHMKPRIEQQLSVLSTDSGILPKDIQNSSFVDDVIEELNSKGISHSDIFCEDCNSSGEEKQLQKRHPHCCQDKSKEPAKKKSVLQPGKNDDRKVDRRKKNNEASRRSRATKRKNISLKEAQITQLEEENNRLSILLVDFTAIATSCKQWIVQKMDDQI